MQAGDIVTINGQDREVQYVEGPRFWITKYPYPKWNPYLVDDCSECIGWLQDHRTKTSTPDIQLHTEDTMYVEDGLSKVAVVHPTGAVRESKEGKGRPDLLLAGFPRALMALCRHMDCDLGRERNWEKGLPESSLIASQFRHLLSYASGVSEDSPEYNLTANAWNAFVALEEYLRVQDGAMVGDVLDIDKPEGD